MNKMYIVLITIFLLIISALVISVLVFIYKPELYSKIMELDDFEKINISQIQDEEGQKIVLDGKRILKDSALVIYKVKSKRIKNEINVRVVMNLASSYSKSPNEFEYTVLLNQDIDKITFGKNRSVVWQKN